MEKRNRVTGTYTAAPAKRMALLRQRAPSRDLRNARAVEPAATPTAVGVAVTLNARRIGMTAVHKCGVADRTIFRMLRDVRFAAT